jgi:hypothetical protein
MFGKDRSPASYPRDIYEHTTNVCFMRLFGLIGSFSLYVAREPFSQILYKNEMDIIREKKKNMDAKENLIRDATKSKHINRS